MIISISRRFIFVHLHKCGGESIETTLAPHLTVNDFLNGASASVIQPWETEMMLDRLVGLNKHASAREIRQRLGGLYDAFFSFATVRRPERRIYSLYSFCIGLVRQSPGLCALLGEDLVQTAYWPVLTGTLYDRLGLTAATIGPALASGRIPPEAAFLQTEAIFTYSALLGALQSSDFATFIRHPDTRRDPAFATQWSMVSDDAGACILTRVVRLEEIDRDWPEVAARLQVGQLAVRHNASDYAGVPAMTPQDAAHLAEVFAVDYEKLGYGLPE